MAYYYNTDYTETLVGKGISLNNMFVNDFRSGKGITNVITDKDKIGESIYTILSTKKGERLFIPDFGSDLYKCVFEQNTLICKDLIKFYIQDALSNWEKRIVIEDIKVNDMDEDNHIIPIDIKYHLANSNIQGNYVYPLNVDENGNINTYSISTQSR